MKATCTKCGEEFLLRNEEDTTTKCADCRNPLIGYAEAALYQDGTIHVGDGLGPVETCCSGSYVNEFETVAAAVLFRLFPEKRFSITITENK